MLFKNAFIFTTEKSFVHGSFRVENGKFAEVLYTASNEDGVDLNGAYVIPGLVDIHSHGNSGVDFSDGDLDGLILMAKYLAKNGVTSFVPASLTLPYEILEKAFINASKFEHERTCDCARLMGIHMEGPFFSDKKKGAQNCALVKLPDYCAFKRLYDASGGLLKIVDIAPELKGAEEFTALASKLCTVSVAHTDADYEEAKAVFSAGATHLTHLFNAMPPLHHRRPGVIGAAADLRNVVAELICDGYHVHESAVRMAFKLFPRRICLISDALRCCGMPDGSYMLGGQEIHLKGGLAKLADGTIAGSASNLYTCMKNAIAFGISKEQAVLSSTLIPARQIRGEKEIGSIEPGRFADFIVCDEALNKKAVYLKGRII